jgi:AraC-like DNA-binding protein
LKSAPQHDVRPPEFVKWKNSPLSDSVGFRKWYGADLDADAVFNVRGIGIYEPMFNENIDRPYGTGDWLIMLFHHPSRLDKSLKTASAPAESLMLWPPGAPQFFSFVNGGGVERHSWMHVEGKWIQRQIQENQIPISTPIVLGDDFIHRDALKSLANEMDETNGPDPIILQNLFQNWSRKISRLVLPEGLQKKIPEVMIQVKSFLDSHWYQSISLDNLSEMFKMSKSHLSHQFQKFFNTSITNYIIQQRMSAAQRRLYDLNVRPGEIAQEVGYPDIYSFSRQFKKYFGFSPSMYRKRIMGSVTKFL